MVAPDLPGYGRSDKPDVTYDCEWINATLMGLVDALGAERVVIAGHDWGGLLVWIMARQYPERIAGVIGVNTPDLPRPPAPPVQILRRRTRDRPFYLVQFQDRGVAEWVFSWGGRPHDDFVDVMFGGPATVDRRRVPARGARRVQARVPRRGRAHAAARVLPEHGSQLGAHRRRSRIARSTCRA